MKLLNMFKKKAINFMSYKSFTEKEHFRRFLFNRNQKQIQKLYLKLRDCYSNVSREALIFDVINNLIYDVDSDLFLEYYTEDK